MVSTKAPAPIKEAVIELVPLIVAEIGEVLLMAPNSRLPNSLFVVPS